MEDKEIIELLIQELIEAGEWFTTKKDPTFEEAPSYYELDQYGDPTENTKKKIVNEIKDYIGDGAVDIENAIELWINEATMQYKVSFIDNLVTQFEPKPVVDQIEAYPIELKEAFNKEEVEDYKAEVTRIVTNHLVRGGPISYEVNPVISLEIKDTILILKYKILDSKDNSLLFDQVDEIKTDLIEQLTRANYRIDRIDVYIDRDKEIGLNLTVQLFEGKPAIETTADDVKIEDSKSIKTESAKTKMEEENTKSLNLISSMFTSEDFDADSPQGQIVIKTSQLFNELSDKGYNVQVNFDNGESQSDILLGDMGGKVTITINGTNAPIKAFTQGSFELTDDVINTLNDIKDQVDNI